MPPDPAKLYDSDFYAWTRQQAELLRRLPAPDNAFDRDRVAEEIEDLGKSERDAVRRQIRRIIEHLLKLEYSPATRPRNQWRGTIIDARAVLADKLTPTLQRDAGERLAALYEVARRKAELALRSRSEPAAAVILPAACPYALEDIARQDWYPDRRPLR